MKHFLFHASQFTACGTLKNGQMDFLHHRNGGVQVAVPDPPADLNQQAGACQPAKAFSGEQMVLKCAV